MDYILEQVKEKGIVKYIESYKEDLEITDKYKKCMEEINNIQYHTCMGNYTVIHNFPYRKLEYEIFEDRIDIERQNHNKYVLEITIEDEDSMKKYTIETGFIENINLSYPEDSYSYYGYSIDNFEEEEFEENGYSWF